jgi:hypothetical protein
MIIAYALPILPGQAGRAKRFGPELEESGHRAAYDELNRLATVRRQVHFVQSFPSGDLQIVAFDVEDPSLLGRAFTDSAYDQWWLDYLRDVHGLDIRAMPEPPPPPGLTFDSTAG